MESDRKKSKIIVMGDNDDCIGFIEKDENVFKYKKFGIDGYCHTSTSLKEILIKLGNPLIKVNGETLHVDIA